MNNEQKNSGEPNSKPLPLPLGKYEYEYGGKRMILKPTRVELERHRKKLEEDKMKEEAEKWKDLCSKLPLKLVKEEVQETRLDAAQLQWLKTARQKPQQKKPTLEERIDDLEKGAQSLEEAGCKPSLVRGMLEQAEFLRSRKREHYQTLF